MYSLYSFGTVKTNTLLSEEELTSDIIQFTYSYSHISNYKWSRLKKSVNL